MTLEGVSGVVIGGREKIKNKKETRWCHCHIEVILLDNLLVRKTEESYQKLIKVSTIDFGS